nr:uncharacterized protein LOC113829593 [Penaeus vannamei]
MTLHSDSTADLLFTLTQLLIYSSLLTLLPSLHAPTQRGRAMGVAPGGGSLGAAPRVLDDRIRPPASRHRPDLLVPQRGRVRVGRGRRLGHGERRRRGAGADGRRRARRTLPRRPPHRPVPARLTPVHHRRRRLAESVGSRDTGRAAVTAAGYN